MSKQSRIFFFLPFYAQVYFETFDLFIIVFFFWRKFKQKFAGNFTVRIRNFFWTILCIVMKYTNLIFFFNLYKDHVFYNFGELNTVFKNVFLKKKRGTFITNLFFNDAAQDFYNISFVVNVQLINLYINFARFPSLCRSS